MSILKNKKVLITGGSGYLGSALIKTLVTLPPEIHVFDKQISNKINNKCVTYHQLDLLDSEKLEKEILEIKPDYIYHLAATLNRTKDYYKANEIISINTSSTINLLNALQKINFSLLIYISTSEIYGNSVPPFNEKTLPKPTSPYSISKYTSELLISNFADLYDKKFLIFRLFNLYGPNLKNMFIGELIKSYNQQTEFPMTLGEQKRDFIYIDDIVDALIKGPESNAKNEILNICSAKSYSLIEIVKIFEKIVNYNIKVNVGSIPYRQEEIWDMRGDNKKAQSLLNWYPKTSIQEGLIKCVESINK